jgi:hypothetical protein
MNFVQNNEFYQLLELQNLLNSFENAYPILIRNIKKFNIETSRDKCFLAWIAGINFNRDIENNFIKKVVQELLFKNIFKSIKIKDFTEKSILFIYFSLGYITGGNSFSDKKDFYKEYLPLISKGAVILEKIKFDSFENGAICWSLSTIKKFFYNISVNEENNKSVLMEDSINEEVSSFIIN